MLLWLLFDYVKDCMGFLLYLIIEYIGLLTGLLQPGPPGPSSIENDAHDIEKLLLKTQVS